MPFPSTQRVLDDNDHYCKSGIQLWRLLALRAVYSISNTPV